LEVFDLREKLIARLAIFESMRPGEILALRWKAVLRKPKSQPSELAKPA
jgi:integrase